MKCRYVQASGEAFSTQKRISSTSSHEMFSFLPIFVDPFFLLDPNPADQNQSGSIRIRIQNTGKNCTFVLQVLFTVTTY